MVFAKNEDGGILPQSRRVQRNAAIAKGYAEANKGSWEKPQTAEQMGLGDDPDRVAEYTHSLEALTAAHKENDAATEKSFETLCNYV